MLMVQGEKRVVGRLLLAVSLRVQTEMNNSRNKAPILADGQVRWRVEGCCVGGFRLCLPLNLCFGELLGCDAVPLNSSRMQETIGIIWDIPVILNVLIECH